MLNENGHSERLLVKQLIRGNENSFHALFDTYREDVYRYALSLLKHKSMADEIVQEVFIKIWTKRNTLDESLSFKSFLMTITKNMALNTLKKVANDGKLREAILYKSQKSYNPIYDQLQERELERVKKNALDLLPPRQRQVFEMARNQGMSYDDIGQELGISKNTVKSQMRKALETLRNHLLKQPDINLSIFLMGLNWMV